MYTLSLYYWYSSFSVKLTNGKTVTWTYQNYFSCDTKDVLYILICKTCDNFSCYGSIPLTLDLSLGLIERDGGLSTVCHSCGFSCQQRVLKTFPGPGNLHSEDGIVWLCQLLVNLCIYIYIYIYISVNFATDP